MTVQYIKAIQKGIIESMPQKLTAEEYHKMLPKKQVGTAVLFFNPKGELLIVKPDYKDTWIVPGGSTDINESPLHCAIRETKEEIGLDVTELELVGVYHSPGKGLYSDSLKFIFYGGILSESDISKILLSAQELEKYTFLPPNEAIPLFSLSLQRSVPQCLDAIKNRTVAYIE